MKVFNLMNSSSFDTFSVLSVFNVWYKNYIMYGIRTIHCIVLGKWGYI